MHTAARERSLSPKYLASLWDVLNATEPSLFLDSLRARWREATPADAAKLAAEVAEWQKALWKFSSVGHIGKAGGPKAWMEPVSPLTTKQEVRLKIPASSTNKEVTLYLVAGDAGDGTEGDFVVWQQPRLVAPGRPNLLLRDVRDVTRELTERRERMFATTAQSLAAAAEAGAAQGKIEVAELARKHGVEADALSAWLDYLGIGTGGAVKIQGYFTNTIKSSSGYDFVKGWGVLETPNLAANSSDRHVRIPGNMKPHGLVVHPSPKLQAAVGWLSPTTATFRVEATVTHAHPESGNGVTWSLERRRGATRQRLANGTAQGGKPVKAGPIEKLAVQTGDFISLLIGPRGDHSCDLTDLEFVLATTGESPREWNLTKDVTSDILAGNPHADRFGNEAVWHFYTEPEKGDSELGPIIPPGSLLARWQSAEKAEDKQSLADEVQKLLRSGPPLATNTPDAALYRQLASLGGPLFARQLSRSGEAEKANGSARRDHPDKSGTPRPAELGPDPALFGRHPNGRTLDPASLCVRAPSVIQIHLPTEL